ncbi:MAG: hypothetical protein H6Q90_6181 [Deltaproteobacteria bacterium]|nr:hypothetical protein [Deltaproteobacteria bacterium]
MPPLAVISLLTAWLVGACGGGSTADPSSTPEVDGGVSEVDGGASTPDGAAPTTYSQVALDLSTLPWGTILTDQFLPHVVVSSTGAPNVVTRYGFGCGLESEADFGPCNEVGCSSQPATTFAFTAPVRGLKFGIGCINDSGKFADLVVVQAGGGQTTIPLGPASFTTVVDLSMIDDITKVTITNITDSYGVSYGDVRFLFPDVE